VARNIRDRSLALAGVFQAASLVDQIANHGTASNAIIENTLETLFRFDAASVEDVYGGIIGVRHGLEVMCEQFTAGRAGRNIRLTRYVISLLVLERKLSRRPEIQQQLRRQLQHIESRLEFFSLGHDAVFSKLAEVYKTTISTLGPKIMVQGDRPWLSSEHNASKVRALLLAGIRSAVLWRQCGGNRWQILFGRRQYIAQCRHLTGSV
jgi:high frequency lysogenization protein